MKQKSESSMNHDQVPPLLHHLGTDDKQIGLQEVRSWEALCTPSFVPLTISTDPVWVSRLECLAKFSISDTLQSDKPAESKSESEQASVKD